ncbi:MAG: alpha/beta hydrolase [Candidatus Dormibacteraeota bacterium]|nr:alpha/beta hydrolase [Candidatus Dormibacteraeota bacterium]
MATFGLVHGAWHGAWCWEAVVPALQARGHSAIAMDLPSDRRDATFGDYAAAVVDALSPSADVVLVGHSLAGMVIPLVALQRPVRVLVFLCALIPERQGDPPGPGPPEHVEGTFDGLVHHADGSHSWPSLEAATRILYQDCSRELAASAYARLRRQQTALWDGLQPMARWPDVPLASIHCQDDRAVNPAWSSWVGRHRLGLESAELPGGHSPMLSRPALLAETFAAIADRAWQPAGSEGADRC